MKKYLEYLPPVFSGVAEFIACGESVDFEMEAYFNKGTSLMLEVFIETASEDGIARYEKMLGIIPRAADTLESRRLRLLMKFTDKAPYTYRSLCAYLENLCGEGGYSINLSPNGYALTIYIELANSASFDEISRVCRVILPANLTVTVELLYTQNIIVSQYTHQHLSNYTHEYIKSGAL